MTEPVVDRLEVVEVDEGDRDAGAVSLPEQQFELVEQDRAVGQPGQGVLGRARLERLEVTALDQSPLGHVGVDRERRTGGAVLVAEQGPAPLE